MRPAANPLAVMQVGRLGRAVARVGFVIAAAGADRPRPAGLAIGLVRDVMGVEERLLALPRDTVPHGSQTVLVGTREAVTQGDAAVGGDAHQANAGATRIRLGVAVMDLLQRLADVREAVVPALQRCLEVIGGQRAELFEQVIEAAVRDGVVAARGGRDRRKADLPESQFVGEVLIDATDVEGLARQRDAGAHRPCAVPLQQRFDLRRRHRVAALPIAEHAELVLHLFGAVDRDRDTDALVGEELDHVGLQQRRVGGEAEVEFLAHFGGPLPRVGDGRLQHREVHQRFTTEERDVRVLVLAGFAQRELDAVARRLFAHELRLLAVRGIDDLVFAVLVTIRAGQVALVGHVDHQRLQRYRTQRYDLQRLAHRSLGGGGLGHHLAQRAHTLKLGDGVGHFGGIEARRQAARDLGQRLRSATQFLQHRL